MNTLCTFSPHLSSPTVPSPHFPALLSPPPSPIECDLLWIRHLLQDIHAWLVERLLPSESVWLPPFPTLGLFGHGKMKEGDGHIAWSEHAQGQNDRRGMALEWANEFEGNEWSDWRIVRSIGTSRLGNHTQWLFDDLYEDSRRHHRILGIPRDEVEG